MRLSESVALAKSTVRRHLDQRFEAFRGAAPERPAKGWVRAIRDALEMTTRQMARRLGISQPQITALEQDELSGRITLSRLQAAAEALGCRFVYAFVPNEPLEEMIKRRAREIAEKQVRRTQHTMRLEDQAIGEKQLKAEILRATEDILADAHRRLWDDP